MPETENLYSLNIRDYFNSRDSRIDVLSGLISSYTCPKNPDIERFLKNSAIDFTRKQQSVTYLAFTKESVDFVGSPLMKQGKMYVIPNPYNAGVDSRSIHHLTTIIQNHIHD